MFCATVLYPYSEGMSFHFEDYAGKLAPLFASALGDNCVKFEVRRGLATPSGPTPQFICIASYWVRSRDEFGSSMNNPEMQEVMAKISTFTPVQPIRQFDEVVA